MLTTEPTESIQSEKDQDQRVPVRPGTWSALRPLVLRLHFYAGLLIAPFLFVAAASGLLYALSYQAEKIVYRHELEVPVGDSVRPLAEQVEAARRARPDNTVTAVWPAAEEGATTRVLMSGPGVEDGRSLAVFVDPYTAEVRGALPSYGGSGALPLRTWLSQVHRDLGLGEPGRVYSELAASWLWVIALGGLALWLGRRRTARRALFLPEGGARSRRRTLSWHGSVGLWATAGLLGIAATGLSWSAYAGENIGSLRERLGGATPSVSAALDSVAGSADSGHEGHEGHSSGHRPTAPAGGGVIGIDQAVRVAAEAGVAGEIAVSLPSEGKGYVVKGIDRQYPVHLDSVAVDPADGRVLDTVRFADYPLLAKLTSIGIALHMGTFLGLPNQLALAVLALALVLLVVWGCRMWWLRRPGRPVGPGAWRRVPPTVLLPLAAGTAAVGWFLPLLGLSLLAFLVVDGARSLAARRPNG
ncbi:PepSY domain-containing protein [Streptomyces sp. MUM 203J]|uniref:PepSY-associated TM helix domain-containing protein n=1 Tax=Streptomyces sp. MUM 203J TaxID=2791990 RepID=UPI001F03441B|nr:PepSY domain-containing protein [Streptomyces sp. MUM 203J]MCH0539125.1 PepSY domain-containing protein [Streptomyces sp. MUM 203J]